MPIREEFEKAGNWLFRWRSYLPLLVIGLGVVVLRDFEHPFGSHRLDQLWEILCLFVSFVGLGIRIYVRGCAAKSTSGRHTRKQVADVLNTTGMYSVVRHPLYLGNFLIWLGISLFVRSWWFSLICILVFWLYYERIVFAEEEFLRKKFRGTFLRWAEKTPAFFPRFKNWQPPELSFSWRNALKREYAGFFGIICVFTLFEIVGDVFAAGKFEVDLMWTLIFSIGLVVYATLRVLTKRKLLGGDLSPPASLHVEEG